MKLSKFIADQCCNWTNKTCIGVFRKIIFNPSYKCTILEKEPESCGYFEYAVLPYAKHLGCYSQVSMEYSAINDKVKVSDKVCKCGNMIEKGKSFCEDCKKKNIKKKNRDKYLKRV